MFRQACAQVFLINNSDEQRAYKPSYSVPHFRQAYKAKIID